MSPEDKKLLEESVVLSRQNNKMLKALQRGVWYSRIWTLLYWGLAAGFAYKAFALAQPYINQLLETYSSIQGTATEVKKSITDLNNIPKNLQNTLNNKSRP